VVLMLLWARTPLWNVLSVVEYLSSFSLTRPPSRLTLRSKSSVVTTASVVAWFTSFAEMTTLWLKWDKMEK
jgi:hypothetical protein